MPRILQLEGINSSSNITFSTGATIERLRIDSSGNVGIGTTTPQGLLEVNNRLIVTTDGNMYLPSGNAWYDSFGIRRNGWFKDSDNALKLRVGTSAEGEQVRITATNLGNVGIGTASPTAKLQVASGDIRISDNFGIGAGGGAQGIYNGTSQFIRFDTASTERLRIDSSGNVGIGQTPINSRRLTISTTGQADLSIVAGSTSYGQLLFGYTGADNKGIVAYNNTDNSMQFYTNSTERLRINASGNVGIGISPIDQLSIGGTGRINFGGSVVTDTTAGIYFHTAGSTAYAIHRTAGAWTASSYQQLRIGFDTGLIIDGGTGYDNSFVRVDGTGIRVATGNIGIGTTTKALTYKLDVYGTNGTDCARIYSSGASSGIDFWDSGGRRGLVYSDGNGFGLLNSAAGWALRVNHGTYDVVIPSGSLTLGKDIITNANYGYGHVGVYSESRFQSVFAMGTPYTMKADGTSLSAGAGGNNFYGIAWSYPSVGGQGANLNNHGALFVVNGATQTAISSSIWCIGNITAYSDERVKTNWRNLDNNFVEKLAKVKSGIFDRTDLNEKENGFKTQVGVSAQSLREVIPNAVTCNVEGMLSVSYGNAAMVSCVELAKEILKLKEEIEILKNK